MKDKNANVTSGETNLKRNYFALKSESTRCKLLPLAQFLYKYLPTQLFVPNISISVEAF